MRGDLGRSPGLEGAVCGGGVEGRSVILTFDRLENTLGDEHLEECRYRSRQKLPCYCAQECCWLWYMAGGVTEDLLWIFDTNLGVTCIEI